MLGSTFVSGLSKGNRRQSTRQSGESQTAGIFQTVHLDCLDSWT